MSVCNILIAHDYSGSTDGHSFYHTQVSSLYKDVTEVMHKDETHIIFLWNDGIRSVSKGEYMEVLLHKRGEGWTSPVVVAQKCKDMKFHGVLVLITDGQVDEHQVNQVDTLLSDWTFKHVHCHVIDTSVSAYAQMNLSVTLAFTRNSPHTITIHKREGEQQHYGVSNDDFGTLQHISHVGTVDDLSMRLPGLVRAVTANTMGSAGNAHLRDELVSLRKRVVSSMASCDTEDIRQQAQELQEALESGQVEKAITAASAITTMYYERSADKYGSPDWDRQLSQLISMCEGAVQRDYSIDLVRAASIGIVTTPITRQPVVEAPTCLEDMYDPQVSADEVLDDGAAVLDDFECPISLDHVPANNVVILLCRHEVLPCLLADLPKHVTDELVVCPLNAFKFPEVINRLACSLDHVISVNSFRDSHITGQPLLASPFTRRPLSRGGIFLGACPEHIKASNWSIAHLLNYGKQAGSLTLWHVVIYMVIKQRTPPCAYLSDVVIPAFETHLRYRLRHETSYASLVGSPQFVTTRLPVSCALWFVHSSARVMHTHYRPEADPVRLHAFHMKYIENVIELCGYPIDAECTEHWKRVCCMLHLVSWYRRDARALSEIARCLSNDVYDAHDGGAAAEAEDLTTAAVVQRWVPIDSPPRAKGGVIELLHSRRQFVLASHVDALGVQCVAALYKLVTEAGARGARHISLPLTWKPPSIEEHEAKYTPVWPHYSSPDMQRIVCVTPISEATCRPLTYPDRQQTWQQKAEETWKAPIDRLYSSEKIFAEYVVENNRYPTKQEYVFHLYRKVCRPDDLDATTSYGAHRVLPRRLHYCIEETFASFEQIVRKVSPSNFTSRYASSMHRKTRAEMDGTHVNMQNSI